MTEEVPAVATNSGARKSISELTTTSQSSGEGLSHTKPSVLSADTSAASASVSAADSEEPLPGSFQLTSDWTSDEQQQLEEALSTFTADKYETLERYIHIAATLPEKNVRDVGLRVKWMWHRDAKRNKTEESSLKKLRKTPIPAPVPPTLARAQSTTLSSQSSRPGASPMQNLAAPSTSVPAPPNPPYSVPAPSTTSTAMNSLQTTIAPLFDQNYVILNQCKTNMADCKVHENLELLMRFRDNVISITNHMEGMKDIMAQMPPLPVRLNTELANSFLPKSGLALPHMPVFPPPSMAPSALPTGSAPPMPALPMDAFCSMPGGSIPGTMGIPGLPMPAQPLMPGIPMPSVPAASHGLPAGTAHPPATPTSIPVSGPVLSQQMANASMLMPGMPGNVSMAMTMSMMPPPMMPMHQGHVQAAQQRMTPTQQLPVHISQQHQPVSQRPPMATLAQHMQQAQAVAPRQQQQQAMTQPQQLPQAMLHQTMQPTSPAMAQQLQPTQGVPQHTMLMPVQSPATQQMAAPLQQLQQQHPGTTQQMLAVQQQQAANPLVQQMPMHGVSVPNPISAPGLSMQMQLPQFSSSQANGPASIALPQQSSTPAIKTEG